MQASASDLPRPTLTPDTGRVAPPPPPPAPADGRPRVEQAPDRGIRADGPYLASAARDWLAKRMPLEDDDQPQAAHIGYLALMRCTDALEEAQATFRAAGDINTAGKASGLLAIAEQYRRLAKTCGQHSLGVLTPPRSPEKRPHR